ncbi:hypothetical protein [Arthrobacter cavernae]|uniref:Uncharacterized protein n=1 Tax=Arthrobacter cavernae TaxID=2817681 RepID=A0A939KM38_9MICC|nr:hypothetical protein [Arthrobacter cavernae]MBO1267811.1 hypothetical protein [Arthrobacter cavernae]
MAELGGRCAETLDESVLLGTLLSTVGNDAADSRDDSQRELGQLLRLDLFTPNGKELMEEQISRNAEGGG